jgi:hypothetical protein
VRDHEFSDFRRDPWITEFIVASDEDQFRPEVDQDILFLFRRNARRSIWRGKMVTYSTEVLSPPGWTAAQNISKQVQAKLESYSAAGWRLCQMVNVSGTGAILGGAIGPFLVLVFEHA